MFKNSKILIVDDEESIIKSLEKILSESGVEVFSALDGEEALNKIDEIKPDLILLDERLPGIGGCEVSAKLKEREDTRIIPIVMMTAYGDKENKIRALNSGIDDFLVKPMDEKELLARVRSLLKVKFYNEQLEDARNVLYVLLSIIDAKDAYTRNHSERVTELSVLLAREVGLSQEEIDNIEKAAEIHDIGKIGVSEVVLNKKGPLTPEEFEEVKKHPVIGVQICSPLRSFRPILGIIRHHHERYDGRGYPDGLKGEEIPLGARIIAIVDSYDAMASDRPYRPKLPRERILNIFNAGKNTQWDGVALEKFVNLLEKMHL